MEPEQIEIKFFISEAKRKAHLSPRAKNLLKGVFKGYE